MRVCRAGISKAMDDPHRKAKTISQPMGTGPRNNRTARVNEDSSENQLVRVKILILGIRSAREPA